MSAGNGDIGWRERLRMFFILQWKNLILKRRHWLLTLVEILVPTLLFVTLVVIRVEGGDEVGSILPLLFVLA